MITFSIKKWAPPALNPISTYPVQPSNKYYPPINAGYSATEWTTWSRGKDDLLKKANSLDEKIKAEWGRTNLPISTTAVYKIPADRDVKEWGKEVRVIALCTSFAEMNVVFWQQNMLETKALYLIQVKQISPVKGAKHLKYFCTTNYLLPLDTESTQ